MTSNTIDIDGIQHQINAIKEYPCVVQIDNAVFTIDDPREMWALRLGLEIGNNLCLNKWDAGRDKPKAATFSDKPKKENTEPVISIEKDHL